MSQRLLGDAKAQARIDELEAQVKELAEQWTLEVNARGNAEQRADRLQALAGALRALRPTVRESLELDCWCPDYHDVSFYGHTPECAQANAALAGTDK